MKKFLLDEAKRSIFVACRSRGLRLEVEFESLGSIEFQPLGGLGEVLRLTSLLSFVVLCGRGLLFRRRGIQPLGLVTMRGDDGDLVGVVGGEVGVEEDEQVGHNVGKGQRRRQ